MYTELNIAADRYPANADQTFRAARPPIPRTTLFQRTYSYRPVREIVYWDWDTTFGRWGAVVVFPDGVRLWTWPKTW
jgi:hypothetical protein